MYQLSVKTHFCASHQLRGYDGPCARLHGHNFRVEARVSGTDLNDIGMLIDFKEVKKLLKQVVGQFDHQLINEIPPFDVFNPTAENMAKYIYHEIAPQLEPAGIRLDSIAIWETDSYGALYSPKE